MSDALPQSAEIVVIGGGIVGCSTAYHLAKRGKKDVILLERSKLTSGTTWHSAAQVRQLRSSSSLTTLMKYSAELYQSLEAETGQSTGWIGCGSLSIAANGDRMTHIRRQASLARAFGIEVEEIDAAEIKKLWPIANTDDLQGGILSPSDGRVSSSDVCAALIKGARGGGVRIFEDAPVTGFTFANGRISGVETEDGTIACEAVALCGGLWSRAIARMAGISAPLYACEHYALITKPFDGIYTGMPVLGAHDGYMYIRDEAQGLLVGSFEPNARPVDLDQLPNDFSFDLLGENWDHFEPIMAEALHRIPALETAEVRMLLNGPESFTLDGAFLMGEAPEVPGFFMCCGMNSMGVASSGGAGKALADWVVDGDPGVDLSSVDVRRFARVRDTLTAVRDRAAENLSMHYAIGYAGHEFESARNLRLSPLHERLASLGAEFGDRGGWERPSWFQPSGGGVSTELRFGKPHWFDCVAREHKAAREAVAVFDQTSFSKILVQGRDAPAFLDRVCAGRMDVPVGRVTYTPILNARGGYESDVVAMRLRDDAYLIVTGSAQQTRDMDLLRGHIATDEFVTLTDMTSAYAVIGAMGPNARTLLSRLSPDDFTNEGFPYLTHREVEIGDTVARAARISYVGELGWELYVPSEAALPLYDRIREAGNDLGLENAGSFAMAGLRIEKGYCAWGHDIGPDDTPLQAGMGFATKLSDNSGFTGRAALERQKVDGVGRRRILLSVDDPGVILMGLEPILVDGEIMGYTTSAAYGHTVGRSVAIGYIRLGGHTIEDIVANGRFEIEAALTRHSAMASLKPLHDPAGARLRG
jgi:glycine cleavage system aminomethyltransferase T/glycine/D-amino acid oxidase-like deaminating enzyme